MKVLRASLPTVESLSELQENIYERTAPSRHRAYLISSMEDLQWLEFGNFNFGDST